MIFYLLAFWHRLTIYFNSCTNAIKRNIQNLIGPTPQSYYLLSDGRILPSTITLPESYIQDTFLYDVTTHRVSHINVQENARFRRLNIIALSFNHESVGNVDISEWIGELRACPVHDFPIKQLLHLWSLTQNRFVPLDGLVLTVTKSDGETDLITLT